MTILMGYADAISVAPGDTIGFKVSCAGAPRYTAEIRRVLSPEAGPDAPPFRSELVDTTANRDYAAREQKLRGGSWAMVPTHPLITGLKKLTIQAFIWPTLPGQGRQAILGTWAETLGRGFGLMLDDTGALEFRIGDGRVPSGGAPLLSRKWYFVAASYDKATGKAVLYQELVADKTMTQVKPISARATVSGKPASQPAPFSLRRLVHGRRR